MMLERLGNPYLFIDTETGGLDPARHSLLSVAFVVGDASGARRSVEILLKHPEYVTDEAAMSVNRIDLARHDAMALDADSALAVMDVFLQQFFPCRHEPAVLVGHNVAFDQAFLRAWWEAQGRDFEARFGHRTVDTHAVASALRDAGKLDLEHLDSDELFAHFGIEVPPEARHTALGDALATFELYWKLVERMR